MGESARRRLGGWGFEGEDFPPTGELLRWLERHLGTGVAVPRGPGRPWRLPAGRELPELAAEVSQDERDRLTHSRGQGLPDILRLRAGAVGFTPDAVCRPATFEEVGEVLERCDQAGIRIIPWGGGTSVTGGVNVIDDQVPTLSLDLERLGELENFDERSRLATFGAGVTGPRVESSLAELGMTLGHFPQSWELSTLGGWVVTRSSGQESLGYGRIDDMVAGLRLVAPAGSLELAPSPGSAAGPDLRRFVLGSEGRFGIVTSVTVRVHPSPQRRVVQAALMRSWDDGLEVVRELTQNRTPLTMLRLSDAPETQVAMAVGLQASRSEPLIRGYLRVRGFGPRACLLLFGATGGSKAIDRAIDGARSVLRRHRGLPLGSKPGAKWLRDRFRHPYLRDGLLDSGYATDTLETAAPWSALEEVRDHVRKAISGALTDRGEAVAVLSHISHPYLDGASLYFTFFFRTTALVEQNIARWAKIKRAATRAIVSSRATLTHHHGIGQWHAPWLPEEIGPSGVAALRAVADALDPKGILNPRVLLDPVDRLEA